MITLDFSWSAGISCFHLNLSESHGGRHDADRKCLCSAARRSNETEPARRGPPLVLSLTESPGGPEPLGPGQRSARLPSARHACVNLSDSTTLLLLLLLSSAPPPPPPVEESGESDPVWVPEPAACSVREVLENQVELKSAAYVWIHIHMVLLCLLRLHRVGCRTARSGEVERPVSPPPTSPRPRRGGGPARPSLPWERGRSPSQRSPRPAAREHEPPRPGRPGARTGEENREENREES